MRAGRGKAAGMWRLLVWMGPAYLDFEIVWFKPMGLLHVDRYLHQGVLYTIHSDFEHAIMLCMQDSRLLWTIIQFCCACEIVNSWKVLLW